MVQVPIVHRELAHAAPKAGAALDALANHQDGVVQHALRALRHRVHPDHKDDVNDALTVRGEIDLITCNDLIISTVLQVHQASISKEFTIKLHYCVCKKLANCSKIKPQRYI